MKAAEDFNIDMSQSWMIGDGENDVKAGEAAGCKSILIDKDIFGKRCLFECVDEVLS